MIIPCYESTEPMAAACSLAFSLNAAILDVLRSDDSCSGRAGMRPGGEPRAAALYAGDAPKLK